MPIRKPLDMSPLASGVVLALGDLFGGITLLGLFCASPSRRMSLKTALFEQAQLYPKETHSSRLHVRIILFYTQHPRWPVKCTFSLIAVAMHITIWIVKSSVGNAVAASIIGALYGPIFPACLSMANDILPPHVHMVSMALMWVPPTTCCLDDQTDLSMSTTIRSSFASLGGGMHAYHSNFCRTLIIFFLAIFPLAAGAMLDARGIKTLTYLTVPLAAAMACIWTLFPSRLPSATQTLA